MSDMVETITSTGACNGFSKKPCVHTKLSKPNAF